MKLLITLFLVATAMTLSACSQSVPKCSDSEVVKLVTDITGEELAKQLGEDVVKMVSFSVDAIRTTNTNQNTGAYECAADLKMTGKAGTSSVPITYSVENTDDGNSIYVNVYGL